MRALVIDDAVVPRFILPLRHRGEYTVTAVTVAGKGRRGSMRMRIRHLTHVEVRYYTMDRKKK